MDLDKDINYDLLTLVNMLLHGSYQFMFLSALSKKFDLDGFVWATKEKDKKCKDSVSLILDLITENGGFIEFAEVAEPKFAISELNPEFIVTRWDEVESWLKVKIEQILKKVGISNYQKFQKNDILDILDSILNNLFSYR